jgi:salicylate biosynthesis isochorismate synthase
MTLSRVERRNRLARTPGDLTFDGSARALLPEPAALVCFVETGPPIEARQLLDLMPEESGFFWEEPGAQWAGLGSAAELRGDGPGRFDQLVEGAERLVSRLRVEGDGSESVRPRFFGGLSFRPTICESLWRQFGSASFVLPRLAVRCQQDRTDWMLTVESDGQTPAQLRAGAVRELSELRMRVARAPRTTPAVSKMSTSAAPARAAADEQWLKQVRSAVATIQQGDLEKVVFARREVVALGGAEPSVAVLLSLLAQQAPESRRFVIRRDGALFVGATPERLVRQRGLEVETIALAGTLHRRAGASLVVLSGELLGSAKDRHEHQLVVGALRTWLEPLSLSVGVPPEPKIRALRYLLHLETPIRARLRSPEHVLRLVEALHPTPAVGGRPRAAAVAWIDAHEQFDRGWYASPVGWFDAAGDGEFLVALRSMLLSRGRGYLYAGAGIVDESVAEQEFAETEDKLQGIHAMVEQLNALPYESSIEGPDEGAQPGLEAPQEAGARL